MKIPVVGMDPSLRHWGLAETELDLDTGVITTPIITIIEPIEEKSKQVRQNSKDLQATEGLAKIIFPAARKAKAMKRLISASRKPESNWKKKAAFTVRY